MLQGSAKAVVLSADLGPSGMENRVNYHCAICGRRWHFVGGPGGAVWSHLPGKESTESACSTACNRALFFRGAEGVRYGS